MTYISSLIKELLHGCIFLFLDKQQEVDIAHVKDQEDQHTDLRSNTIGRPSARREGNTQPQQTQASSAGSNIIKPVLETKPDTIHLPKGK